MANNSMLFEHAQRFMREVMADRLREEGFVSYKGEDIHWYRLINNNVLQALYFVTRSTALQGNFIDICYGVHPLFITPFFQKSPYMCAMPGIEQMYNIVPELVPGSTPYGIHRLMVYGSCNAPYRIPDIMISCPKDKNNGLDVLELVFPTLDKVQTPYACYEMHKRIRTEEWADYGFRANPASYFVDEVLFWEDKEFCEICRNFVNDYIPSLQRAKEIGRYFPKIYSVELDNLLRQQRVFESGCRDEHLQFLKEREQKNFKLLEKYTGISLSKP